MTHTKVGLALAAGFTSIALLASHLHAQTVGTGVFPDTALIEQHLRRGVSKKDDVQRLLGVPNGTGRSEIARPEGKGEQPMGNGPREIWYYDNIEVTDTRSGAGTIDMSLRQQILLVFFKMDIFDGYLWTSNAFKPAVDR